MKNVYRCCSYYFIAFFLFSFHYVSVIPFSFVGIKNSIQKLPVAYLRLFGELRTKRGFEVWVPMGKIALSWMIVNGVIVFGCKQLDRFKGANNPDDNFFLRLEQKVYNTPFVGSMLKKPSMQKNNMIYQYNNPCEHLNWYGKTLLMLNCFTNCFVHLFSPKNKTYDEKEIKEDSKNYDFGKLITFCGNESEQWKGFCCDFVQSFLGGKNGLKIVATEPLFDESFRKKFPPLADALGKNKNIDGSDYAVMRGGVKKLLEYYIVNFIAQQVALNKNDPEKALYATINRGGLKDFFARTMADKIVSKIENNESFNSFISLFTHPVSLNKFNQALVGCFFTDHKPFVVSSEPLDLQQNQQLQQQEQKNAVPNKAKITCGDGWKAVQAKLLEEYKRILGI